MRKMIKMLAISTALVIFIVVLAKSLELEQYYIEFLVWSKTAGSSGVLFTGLLLFLSVLLLLPSIYLTLGAGLLFGVFYGAALVVVAETIASIVAFGIGRSSMFKPVHRFLSKSEIFTTINTAAEKGGWELVAATRMVPFFPFKMSNYVFGVTSVDVRSFIIGTFIGLWPIALFNAYLGSIAGDVMALGSSGANKTPAEWFMYIAGFGVLLVMLVLLAMRANKRLNLPDS